MGCVPFHMGLCLWEVPAVNPSVTAAPCQLPLAREPFCARYRSMCDTGLFRAFNRQRGEEILQKPQPKTGVGAETYHPSQSEGSISRWLGGILKGKTPNGSELFSP